MKPELDAAFKEQLQSVVRTFREKRGDADGKVKADCMGICLIIEEEMYDKPFKTSQDLINGLESFFRTEMRSTKVYFFGRYICENVNGHPLVKGLRRVFKADIKAALIREGEARADALMCHESLRQEALIEENGKLKGELEEKENLILKQEAVIVSQNEKIERIDRENKRLRVALNKAGDEITGLKDRLYQLGEVEVPRLNGKISGLTEENIVLGAKVSDLANKNETLEASVALLQRSINRILQENEKKKVYGKRFR